MMLPPTKTDLSQEERHKMREQILHTFKQNVTKIQFGSENVSPTLGKFDKLLSTSIQGRNSGNKFNHLRANTNGSTDEFEDPRMVQM